MFFLIIGFLALVLILGWITAVYGLVCLNGLGKYNIGAVENSNKMKVVLVAGLIALGYIWYKLFEYAPFNISISM